MSFLISITGGLIALFFLLVFILVLSIISIFIGSNLTILFLFGVLIAYLYLKKQDKQSIVLKQKEEQGIQLKDKEEKVKHLENESKVLDSEPIKRLLKGFVSRIPTRIIIKESDTIDLKSHWEDDDVVIVHNILVGYADEFEDPNKFYDQADEFDELKEILVKKYSLDILNINDAILKKKLFVLFYQKLCHDIDKVIIPAQDENEAIERYLHIYDVSSKSGLPIKCLTKCLNDRFNGSHLSDQLYQKISEIKEKKRLEGLEQKYVSQKLENVTDFNEMSGHQFEDYLQEYFSNKGYHVKRPPKSRDHGADLVLEKFSHTIVVQAKNYSDPVGNQAIRDIFAARSHYKCDEAWVITTSSFSKDAQIAASKLGVRLMCMKDLESL